MKSKVFKCVGLGLSLQGLVLGDFCEICGMEHKPGQCPKETLEFRLDELAVDDWDSDVEEGFVREYELEAQRLRGVRNRHHYRTLKRELSARTDDTGTLEIDPLKADRVYRALLEKCDRLLSEVEALYDLVQVLDMGQTCKVCKEETREEEQRRLEREEAARRRIAEEEARKPKGFTGQQIVDRTKILRQNSPMKVARTNQMVRAKRIQLDATYLDLNQLNPFFMKHLRI